MMESYWVVIVVGGIGMLWANKQAIDDLKNEVAKLEKRFDDWLKRS